MNLGLFVSPGDSLTKQKQSGQLDRLNKYYLSVYAKHFDRIYLFSYGDNGRSFALSENVRLIPKPKLIPKLLYQLILPFIHRKIISDINVFRVFQAPGGLPALVSKIFFRKPYVVSDNYDYVRFARVENRPFLATLLKLILPPILKYADQVITPQTIPNGVDPKIFKPDRKLHQPYLILSIGRLTLQKNFEKLIQPIGASRYKSKIKLVIIGVGPRQKLLEKSAADLKIQLKIIPNIDHRRLVSWYQKAAVFSLTSQIEGQPKVLLEAMSSACACLTADFPGNLIKEGVTGMIGKNDSQLTAKLDQLLSDPGLSLRLGANARQLVISRFDLNKLVLKEIQLLQLCAKA